jgi:hypothetical protein
MQTSDCDRVFKIISNIVCITEFWLILTLGTVLRMLFGQQPIDRQFLMQE